MALGRSIDKTSLIKLFGEKMAPELSRLSEDPLGSILKRYPEAAIKYGIDKPLHAATQGVSITGDFTTGLIADIIKDYFENPVETIKQDLKWGAAIGGGAYGLKKFGQYAGPRLMGAINRQTGMDDLADEINKSLKNSNVETPPKKTTMGGAQYGDDDLLDTMRQKVIKEYSDAGYSIQDLDYIFKNMDEMVVLQGPNKLRQASDEFYGAENNPLNKIKPKAQGPEDYSLPDDVNQMMYDLGEGVGMSKADIDLIIKEGQAMMEGKKVVGDLTDEELLQQISLHKSLREIFEKQGHSPASPGGYMEKQDASAWRKELDRIKKDRKENPEKYPSFKHLDENLKQKEGFQTIDGMTGDELDAVINRLETEAGVRELNIQTKMLEKQTDEFVETTMNDFFKAAGGERNVLAGEFSENWDDLWKAFNRGLIDDDMMKRPVKEELNRIGKALRDYEKTQYWKKRTKGSLTDVQRKDMLRKPEEVVQAEMRLQQIIDESVNNPWLQDLIIKSGINVGRISKKKLKN